jgi:capsule biosynthesis phosphatase
MMAPVTVVVDVDDTISTTVDHRDYANAIPKTDVIQRINELYDAGVNIVLYTARGMYTFDGDIQAIEKYNRPILEAWLSVHDVKYTTLKFGKPLAVYYVDDKAIRPDELVSMKTENFSGGSGAKITRFGDRVLKFGPDLRHQYDWYKTAARLRKENNFFYKSPRVNAFFGDTLDMEYVEGRSLNEEIVTTEYHSRIERLMLELISSVRNCSSNYLSDIPLWETMVSRIGDHFAFSDVPEREYIWDWINDLKTHEVMNDNRSMCHGDLTFGNVIVTQSDELCYIDPNSPPGLYSSYLLDFSKILQSCIGYEEWRLGSDYRPVHNKYICLNILANDGLTSPLLVMLTVLHLVRMIKYKLRAIASDASSQNVEELTLVYCAIRRLVYAHKICTNKFSLTGELDIS